MIICFLLCLFFLAGCAGNSPPAKFAESPPCEDCLSTDPPAFNIKVKNSFQEKSGEILLDTAAVIGVLPALKVIAESPENCDYCHAFSESAVEFDFAAKEDSVLRVWFPNNERILIYPENSESSGLADTLGKIPLSQNGELKALLKKIGRKNKVRYLAFASFIYVRLTSRKSFEWESEWSIWDTEKGEVLFWDYRNLEAVSKNSAPVDRGWAGVFF